MERQKVFIDSEVDSRKSANNALAVVQEGRQVHFLTCGPGWPSNDIVTTNITERTFPPCLSVRQRRVIIFSNSRRIV